MYRIVYVSAAVNPFSKSALLELLTKASEKNQRLGVTGLLLYKDGDFIQMLEGERTVVEELFKKIGDDRRHARVIVLIEGETDERLFKDWSMGFRDLSDPEVQATPGFSQFMNTPLVPDSFSNDPSGCLDLLSLFKPRY